MLKHRPIVYLALIAALGGLVIAGVPFDRVLFLAFIVFMLLMHLGGHRGHGGTGHEGHGTNEDPAGYGHVSPAPKEHEEAGK